MIRYELMRVLVFLSAGLAAQAYYLPITRWQFVFTLVFAYALLRVSRLVYPNPY